MGLTLMAGASLIPSILSLGLPLMAVLLLTLASSEDNRRQPLHPRNAISRRP
jgi:hypothetical protein